MARMQLGFAGPEDAAGLAALLTESTQGFAMPAFALERQADIFRIMEARGTDWKIIVARDTESGGRLAAYASVAYRQVYENGRLRRVGHLLDVFFSPVYRGGMLLSRSYAFVKENALQGEAYAQTQVCIDNSVALKAFTSGRGGLPAYLPYGDHAFITLPIRDVPGMGRAGASAKTYEVRRANLSDIPAMQAFSSEWGPEKQFYPHYEFDRLGDAYYRGITIDGFFLAFRNGRLAGMTGTWDQQEFKSTRYLDPRPVERSADPSPTKASMSPGGDGEDSPLFLHSILMEHNNPAVFAALVDGIRAAYRESEFGFLALGLDVTDPLRYGVEHIPHRASVTHHFLVTFGRDPRPDLKSGVFYLESARC
jgi:hypothetical protein